jgi:phage regulator Rha-like protein
MKKINSTQLPTAITAQLTMSSREIAKLVESRHDSVKRTIERLAERGTIELPPLVEISTATKPISEYLVNKRDSYVIVAQLSPEFTARLVDRWQELESKTLFALPDFTNPAIAARAWADEVEAKQIAIATKAEIGSRREATAMNTASQAVKKASRLERALDRSMEYCTIKRMQMIYHGQPFNWRLLKSTSIEMGLDPISVFDANYGTVKAYHADVWREAYALDIPRSQA